MGTFPYGPPAFGAPGMSSVTGVLAAIVLWALCAPSAAAESACLSISPLRLAPRDEAAALADRSAALIDLLRQELGEEWSVHTGGECPSSKPVLDLFQTPQDAADSPTRVRLEWRGSPGSAVVALPHESGAPPTEKDVALLIAQVVRTQLLSQVSIDSRPSARVSVFARGRDRQDLGWTPVLVRRLPGPLRLELEADGFTSLQIDTALAPGQDLRLQLRLAGGPQKASASRPGRVVWQAPWLYYGIGGFCLAASGIFAYFQSEAQDRYSNLGPEDRDEEFSERWAELRRANLARNGTLGMAVLFGGIGVILHFQ